jgi:uncharacterized integral membrane protein
MRRRRSLPDSSTSSGSTAAPAGPASNDATVASDDPDAGASQLAAVRPPRTRTSAAFMSLVAGAVVLVLLLVFILENTRSTSITYFGATGHLPLGVALLLAAVAGALLVGIVGTARIAQLRRRFKHRPSPRGAHDRAER